MDPDQKSASLMKEIMQLDMKINEVMALNGNQEDSMVKLYRQLIDIKRSELNKINYNYQELSDFLKK